MHIRCPHCHNAIEIVDDSSFKDVECPSCGSHFNLLGSAETTEPHRQIRTIGHFEIIEQVGFGHFGSVWKAKDTKLDRTVAIKIPRKDQLDETDTELFFREARAAGQLRHPNIVGVHEVGRDGDIIFIVSDYIDGATLKDWVKGQPLPPREAAKLCAKIAEAVHAAHEAGVVHRDLKPGNVMMDLDGAPHVMDFGLAKRDSGEITMTVDGATFGTPAYMSPEQARGKAHEADRRSDVYALGVILFELLTGELPFRGEKRILLVQIQNDEPPSPRKLNFGVPKDLETICLKCLEKEPHQRYASAQEFVEDLDRYVKDEPIRARPVGWAERGWRWCKRKPAISALSATLAVGMLISLASVTMLWLRAVNAEADALAEKTRANDNFENAQQVVDEFFTEVSESGELLRGSPGTHKLRARLLQKARDYFQQFAEDNANAGLEPRVARAHFRLGDILNQLGELDESKQAYRVAISILDKLVRAHPDLTEHRVTLADSYSNLGVALATVGENQHAIEMFNKGIEEWIRIVARHPLRPEYRHALATKYSNLGLTLQRTSQNQVAIETFGKAIELIDVLVEQHPTTPEYRSTSAQCYTKLGNSLHAIGQTQQAIDLYRKAIEFGEILVEQHPNVPMHRSGTANSYSNLGIALETTGRAQEAIDVSRKGIKHGELLVEQNPDVPTYRVSLADGYSNVGVALMTTGQNEQAIEMFRLTIELTEALVEQDPELPEYQISMVSTSLNMGIAQSNTGHTRDAIDTYGNGIKYGERLVELNPLVPEYRDALAGCYSSLGFVYSSLGEKRHAIDLYSKSIEAQKALIQQNPDVLEYRLSLAMSCFNLVPAVRDDGDPTAALVLLDDAEDQLSYVLEKRADDSRANLWLRNVSNSRSKTLNVRARRWAISHDPEKRNGELAVLDARKACELTGYENSRYLDTLAAGYAETENFEEAVKWQEKGIELAPEPLKAELRERLQLYRQGKPYREPPPEGDGRQW